MYSYVLKDTYCHSSYPMIIFLCSSFLFAYLGYTYNFHYNSLVNTFLLLWNTFNVISLNNKFFLIQKWKELDFVYKNKLGWLPTSSLYYYQCFEQIVDMYYFPYKRNQTNHSLWYQENIVPIGIMQTNTFKINFRSENYLFSKINPRFNILKKVGMFF